VVKAEWYTIAIILFTSMENLSKIYMIFVIKQNKDYREIKVGGTMKKKLFAVGLMICILILGGIFSSQVMAATEPASVDVLFLHDTHSHLNEFATVENGRSQVLGGFAKIKTLIKS
jgi:2',3'-cyclic-nucleotide 2'-phosphodiesterase (5'-nucleotidase family)